MWSLFGLLWVIQIKSKYTNTLKKKKTANKWRIEKKRKKTANDHPIVFLFVYCLLRVYDLSMLFPTTLTLICTTHTHTLIHIQLHAHTHTHIHHASKYRFAVMYLLLRLIVLNLAHKNSNVFAHQKVFSQHIKRQSTLYDIYMVWVCVCTLQSCGSSHDTVLSISLSPHPIFYVQLKKLNSIFFTL